MEVFLKGYTLNNEFMQDFLKYSEEEGVKKDEEGYKVSETYIKNFIKAWIARNLWDYDAYWRISNEQDDVYLKAVEAIQSKDMFKSYKIFY